MFSSMFCLLENKIICSAIDQGKIIFGGLYVFVFFFFRVTFFFFAPSFLKSNYNQEFQY